MREKFSHFLDHLRDFLQYYGKFSPSLKHYFALINSAKSLKWASLALIYSVKHKIFWGSLALINSALIYSLKVFHNLHVLNLERDGSFPFFLTGLGCGISILSDQNSLNFYNLLVLCEVNSSTFCRISCIRCAWKYDLVFFSGYKIIRIAFCPYIIKKITKLFITTVKF